MGLLQLLGFGPNASVEAQVDPTFNALRANLRPTEYMTVDKVKIGGHYYLVCTWSNTAAKPAAASDVLSLRWLSSELLFLLKRFVLWSTTTTVYTASLAQDFALFKAQAFSVSPSAGTQVIPLAGSQKARTSLMKAPLASGQGVLWVSSGDLLTAGTRTLDTQPMGYASFLNPITTPGTPQSAVLYEEREHGQHPVVLEQDEGLVLQTPIGNAQAAGVSKYAAVLEYATVPAF